MKQKKGIDKKLDDAWSLLVKLKAGMKCEYCGKTSHLNSHHIYSRSKRSTRWSAENGISLCVGHHVFSSSFSAHKTPLEFIHWLEDYKGKEHIEKLRFKANGISKLSLFEKEYILKELLDEIDKLQ
jgi:hypothetical protein